MLKGNAASGSPDRANGPYPDGRERRVDRRVATSRDVPVVLLAGDRTLGPAVKMRCVNISTGGMRLEGPAPLVRGGRAAVELVSGQSRRRAVVGIEVVYSHVNHRGDCDAGVRFVKLQDQIVESNFIDPNGRLRSLERIGDEPGDDR